MKLCCRHLSGELVTAAGAGADPEGAGGEAARAAAGRDGPAAVQTVAGSTGQGLRALALHNCSSLTLADLGALAGSCPHLQMLLLGGSGLHVPAEATDRHGCLTAARVEQCWSLHLLLGGPTGDATWETAAVRLVHVCSLLHAQAQKRAENTIAFPGRPHTWLWSLQVAACVSWPGRCCCCCNGAGRRQQQRQPPPVAGGGGDRGPVPASGSDALCCPPLGSRAGRDGSSPAASEGRRCMRFLAIETLPSCAVAHLQWDADIWCISARKQPAAL